MKVVRINMQDAFDFEEMAACIGYFDGMHVGHMKLVENTLIKAKEKKLKSACITFDPDPWVVIKQMQDPAHITSMEERISIGESAGLDYWIILHFTKELADMSTDDFEKMLSDMHVKCLVCGFDYTYGKFGKGNVQTLKKQQLFDIVEVNEVLYENEKISSTRIEKAIENGKMKEIIPLLGRPYSMKGSVIHGLSNGKRMGYPTINLKLEQNYILPAVGVYIGYVIAFGKHYRAMMNIGHNPTVSYRKNVSIEAYLLDFEGDLYDESVELIFMDRIRDEKEFKSKEELVIQLDKDVLKAKALPA